MAGRHQRDAGRQKGTGPAFRSACAKARWRELLVDPKARSFGWRGSPLATARPASGGRSMSSSRSCSLLGHIDVNNTIDNLHGICRQGSGTRQIHYLSSFN